MVKSNGLYQSLHNFETSVRVAEALMSFDESRFERISVVAFCGIVELSGSVSSYFDKALAMRIAKRVAGVSTVVESIRILQKSEVSYPMVGQRRRKVASMLFTGDNASGRFGLATG
jgi:hypothetical protein